MTLIQLYSMGLVRRIKSAPVRLCQPYVYISGIYVPGKTLLDRERCCIT